MHSEMLRKAEEYEGKYVPHIPAEERPAFHVTPAIGWMNDPNGFSMYKGEYHLFYQCYPYTNEWGPVYWGHVKTKDFLSWERLPIALAPGENYDAGGCFSGGALELPDGRQLLAYTGCRIGHDEEGFRHDIQTQCVAVGDGVTYEKWPQNPVLTEADLPEGGSRYDFRDPKVWWGEDGTAYMVVGNRTTDDSGAILLYRSTDGFKWELARTLDQSHNKYGKMWECPDFFALDGKQVLITSPQEMRPVGLEFHAGHGTLALIGEYDPEKGFTRQNAQAIDYGLDFYAPQTLETPDGRRIMIAWMQSWSSVGAKSEPCRWFGQMTLPRELRVKDGRLYQNPVRELENYRGPKVEHRNIPVSAEVNLPEVQDRVLDMAVTVRAIPHDSFRWFRIRLAKDGEHETVLRYRPDCGTLKIDRTRSGLPYDIVHTRSLLVNPKNGELQLRIILDRFSIEVFVNDGEQAASTVIYTRQEADAITFEASGTAIIDVEKYALVFNS